MDIDSTKLTVFFEAPFWVGVFECIEKGKLSVCKVTFGAEPKDYEVWEYLLKNYSRLHFSPSVETVVKKEAVNPKRLQRQIRKEVAPWESVQNHSRRCKCSEKKASWCEKYLAANSAKKKSSVNLN